MSPDPLLPEPVRTPLPEPVRTPLPEPVRTPLPEPVRTPLPEPVRTPLPEPVRTPLPEPVEGRLTRLLAALAGLAIALIPAVAALPTAYAAEQVVETVVSVPGTPEPDGRPVALDATLLTTDPATPRPAIVLAHGLGGSKDDSLGTALTLARDGYAVIIYSARGFGASGGLVHLDSPEYEGADAVRLVDFTATRPEVRRDGDDPVIGFAGVSYGGAVSLVAAGLDPRVDAIVPAFTYSNLAQALVPQYRVDGAARSPADVTPVGGTGVFKRGWSATLFSGSTAATRKPGSTGEQALCGTFAADFCRAYVETAQSGRVSPALVALLDRAAPARLLSKITAPTLLLQGEDDTLFGLDQADANLRGLPASTPAAMAWVPGGHDGDVSVDSQLGLVTAWFDRYLKGHVAGVAPPSPDPTFQVTVPETSLVGADGDGGRAPRVLSASTYPGRTGGVGTRTVPLSGDAQVVRNPAGGTPAALTSLPGAGAAFGGAASLAGYPLAVLAGQAAIFTSAPLTAPLDLVGSGRVRVRVTSSTPGATLFASVWDLGPDDSSAGSGPRSGPAQPNSAVLPGQAVAPVRVGGLSPGQPDTVEIALPAVSHQVPVGHRLRVVLSSTDQAYAGPLDAATYTVALADPDLLLPELPATTASGGSRLDVPVALVVGVGVVVLAALAGLLLLWRRRRSAADRSDLAAVPLAVDGLVKTYADGLKAVDGVSFRAEAGQVVGLLGPNGAGKTTTLRMLVGLIRPDAGTVYVQGRPVHAGADVLGAVGAFIEGPGFLPHLSGLANLHAYWQATGRPDAEARFEEVLEIAGLGSAVHRKVRGYSQGMRQRLGIAQAMLGFPPLLLLDEPTNGLDPPQIKTMRGVLADYAATGRTVVVSSHLLAEVEQSCDHVVMMNRGTVVLAGATADLTAGGDVTLVGLAPGSDLGAAADALRGLDVGAEAEDGRLRVVGPASRPAVVSALVDAGFGVESVDARRHLEEVFMSLMGTHEAGGTRDGD